MKEDSGINDWLRFITGLLTLSLPIAQVFSQNQIGLFIGGDSFFLVSIIALITSLVITIAYITNPHFDIQILWWKENEYDEYLHKTNPRLFSPDEIKKVGLVKRPFRLNPDNLSILSIITLIISGLLFIKIGLDVKIGITTKTNETIIFQSLLYVLSVISASYSLTRVTHSLIQRNKWTASREKRAEKAISLAKKMDGFEVFPKVNFVGCWDDNSQIPLRFVTEVKINDDNFQIFTDSDAQVITGVIKLKKNSG